MNSQSSTQSVSSVRDYQTLLGALFHASPEEAGRIWLDSPEERRKEFLRRITYEEFDAFLRWKLGPSGVLDKSLEEQLAMKGRQNLVRAMRDEMALKELFANFEREGFRFAPIKGIDLAFRIYPSPSLRPFGDWDIFFHPDDINDARKWLFANGWRELHEHIDRSLHHHYTPVVKGSFCLEPHRTLSHFGQTDPMKVWSHLHPIAEGKCYHVLEPELNVLLMARHASEVHYLAIGSTKLLLDTAFVMAHDDVDWKRVRQLSEELNQTYAGNLFASFPEFFPPEEIEAMAGDPEQVRAYREVFNRRSSMFMVSSVEFRLNSNERFSWQWFKACFRAFRPWNARMRHRLPEKGAWGRLLLGYCKDFVPLLELLGRRLFHFRDKTADYMNFIGLAEKKD